MCNFFNVNHASGKYRKTFMAQGRRMSLTAVFSLPDYKIAINKTSNKNRNIVNEVLFVPSGYYLWFNPQKRLRTEIQNHRMQVRNKGQSFTINSCIWKDILSSTLAG